MLAFGVQTRWYVKIKDGKKTWELRLNSGPAAKLQVGSMVRLRDLDAKVLEVRYFASWLEALHSLPLSELLPGCRSVENGVRVYQAFPGYSAKIGRFGAVAFRFQLELKDQRAPATRDLV